MTTTGKDKSDDASPQPAACDVTVYGNFSRRDIQVLSGQSIDPLVKKC